MNPFPPLLALIVLLGAVSCDKAVRQAIDSDPKIVFDAIERNPEQFVETVNRSVQNAQRKQYENQAAEARKAQEEELKNPRKPELEDARRLVGDGSEKIVLIEYTDFQCPACRMAHESLTQFKEKHKGNYQLFVKNMPLDFHPMALPAAAHFEALRLQDRAKAKQFYDFVFTNQKTLADEAFLKKVAQKTGADMARLERDLKSETVKSVLTKDREEFEKFGFTGTPVLILNGVTVSGAQRLAELERILALTQSK